MGIFVRATKRISDRVMGLLQNSPHISYYDWIKIQKKYSRVYGTQYIRKIK